MRWWGILVLLLALGVFHGCGGGGGGVSLTQTVGPVSGAVLSGKAYFADRQLYGGIPIQVRDLTGRLVASTRTDQTGTYAFFSLPLGVYDLVANTGDSEVVFAAGLQITEPGKVIPEVSLLCLQRVVIDQITANSVRISFRSNKPALTSVEFAPLGDSPLTQTVSQGFTTDHKITLVGLSAGTAYGFSLILTGEDGQKFRYEGLSTRTAGVIGPTNLSLSINRGDYETRDPTVTLTVFAENAMSMRVGPSEDLSGVDWESFLAERTVTFDATPGTKRIFCQFRSANGIISPVIEDSIVYSAGTGTFAGIWINGGRAFATSTAVVLTLLFPGAQQMIISNTSDFPVSFWEPFVESRRWTLPSGDGQKTVYARFKGGMADPDRTYSASIQLDTAIPTGTMVINGGAAKTATTAVRLDFTFQQTPVSMQVANGAPPASGAVWLPFENPKPWTLSRTGSGTQTVYAVLRTATNYQIGPLSASIEVDDVAPAGNGFVVRASTDPTAATMSAVLAASLPVYLHFEISDQTTAKVEYAITPSTVTTPSPSDYKTVGIPFRPVTLTQGAFPAADCTIWFRSYDELDNMSAVTYAPFSILGPRLIVTPSEVIVRSNDQVQFTAIGTQTVGDLGPINWFLNGPGTINGSKYTAPPLIAAEGTAVVTAQSSYQPELSAQATIQLRKRVELSYLDLETGLEQTLTEVRQTLGFDSAAAYVITVWNSTAPFDIVEGPGPGQGTASITEPQILPGRYRARLTYSSPSSAPGPNDVTVRVRPRENPSASGTFIFQVQDFPLINLTPLQVNATPGAAIQVKAAVQSNAAETVEWTILGAASFDPTTPVTMLTTSTDHAVTVYGTDTRRVETVQVRASLLSNPAKAATCTITITPPVRVQIFKDVLLTERFPNNTAETVAEVGKIQFFVGVTPREINDTSVTWTINGVAGGATIGSISTDGLYSAPPSILVASVKVRATSNYDTSASDEVTVQLSDFWVLVRQNMTDRVTGSPMPVSSVLVHPYTASGSDFQVFAGTNGYGVWNSSLTDLTPATSAQKPWKGVQGLSTTDYDPNGRYIINGMAFCQDGSGLYVATLNGLYFIALPALFTNGIVPDLAAQLVDLSNVPGVDVGSTPNFLAVEMGRDPKEIFVATTNAIFRFRMVDSTTPQSGNIVLDIEHSTRVWETRSTTDNGSPPVTIYTNAYSYDLTPNEFLGNRINAMAYDRKNDRLFAGGDGGFFLRIGRTDVGNLSFQQNVPIFLGSAGSATYLGTVYSLTSVPVFSSPAFTNEVILATAVDPNTPTTVWVAANTGLKRSTNSGVEFALTEFGEGSSINTRCILVDPTNVINVMAGSEDGLYRTTNAGTTWRRIKSGLGNHKTINSLTQAGGAAGARRRVWVGTTGGVFLGRQSLDLE